MYIIVYIMTDRGRRKPLTDRDLFEILNGEDSELEELELDEDDGWDEETDLPTRGKTNL